MDRPTEINVVLSLCPLCRREALLLTDGAYAAIEVDGKWRGRHPERFGFWLNAICDAPEAGTLLSDDEAPSCHGGLAWDLTLGSTESDEELINVLVECGEEISHFEEEA